MPVPVPLNFPPLVLIISISRYHLLILHVISCATISTVPPSNKKKSYNETNFKNFNKKFGSIVKGSAAGMGVTSPWR